ncbi:MAG: gliding motility-associated C-terminal domain-containing protein [Crocinitomicaceae bacterium]|nr:gliding motility-associated C-terminal domain-containing protein [Crocinitomicaceae bacterium]
MKTLLTLIASIFIGVSVQAQCAFDNTYLLDATPGCPGTFTALCINGGQYVTVNVVAGNTYTFTTCGNAAFDTQITVYDAPGTTVLGYNDDDCGLQSTVTWVATFTGSINVLVDEFNCSNTGACTDLAISCALPVQSGSGCNTNTTICTPGQAGPFAFSTPGDPVGSCLNWIGLSYAYIVLYITQSGPLEILIDGDAATGFLDVAIFDVPAGVDPCIAQLDAMNEIGCNYAIASSGCNQFGTAFPCASSVPAPPVVAGDVVFIVVENWSNASTTFTLDLAAPPAAQTGPPDGTITPVATMCSTDPALQLNAVDNGGLWTGTGVSPTGLFNPAAAGVGIHTIDYVIGSVPCQDAGQTTIEVIDCASPCFMNFFSYAIGACDPTDNTFEITGEVQFTNAPTTGTLTVTDCNGNQDVFFPPFVSPTFYTLSGIDSDGTANCDVTAVFTADPACTFNLGLFDYPSGCICTADAGTFTDGTTGSTQTTGPWDLCFGDELDITALGDYTPPQDFTIGWTPPPAPVYDPGEWLLVFDCPPTTVPPADLLTDPCLLGVASSANQAWTIVNNAGDGATLWFQPVTMYSMVEGIYAISINGGEWCYDLGPAYEVTFLEEILTSQTQDCQAGTASVTINGGLPAHDGSNFTASNLVPGNAGFVNSTTGEGGTIVIDGLLDGDNWSYDIVDANNCPITVSGTFTGTEDPSFTYPSAAYCQDEPNPSPTITGVTGGQFTAPAGVSINAFTGVINLGASTAGGPYTITYTTPDAICFDQATFDVTINPLPIVDGNDETICAGDMVTLSGTGADTYTWTAPVLDNTAFAGPAVTTVYTVTGTITATGCQSTGTVTVTVNPLQNATFTTTDFCEGTASPAATITGTPGGTFVFNPAPGDGATVNAATGSISNGVGGTTYTLEYTTPGPCPATLTQTVTVDALPVVDVPDYSICTGGTVTLTATGANTYVWAPGTYLTATTGASVDCTPTVDIAYTVTGTDANGCVNTDMTNVTIIPNAPINAGADVAICAGDNTTLTATGGVTYNWQAPISAAGAVQTVSPATTTVYTVDGVDAQGCSGTDQVTVTVNPLPTATIAGTASACIGDPSMTVTFTGANGTAPYTFTYNLNGGANQTISSVGNTATITVGTGTAGTFNYNLVSVEDASSTNCSQPQVGIATIIVNPLPTATIVGTASACIGDPSMTVTFTGANGTAPYTFTYNLNGGANQTITSVGNTATVTVGTGTAGTFNYNLVSVEDASSTNCSQPQVGIATIIVNPLPTATIAGTASACVGDPALTVTFTGANGTAPYTFTYNLNGGANQTITSVGNTATVTVGTGTAGTFNYNLVSVEDASSTNCSQPQVGIATIIVNPLPTAIIAGTASACVGDPALTITFTGANGTAPYTFTYNINGGANQTVTSVGTMATVTAPTGTAGTFNYNLVSVQDASSTNCSQPQVGVATVIVNPMPTATIAGTASACVGDPALTITFTGANGTAPYTFTYNLNGGANQTITSVGTTATVTAPTGTAGTFNYNLVSVEDASSTACSQAQPGLATVTINANPTPVINGATEYCTGTSATLSTTIAYTSYVWSTGDVTPTTNVTVADNPITVTVTNAFGCSGTSAVFNVLENTVIVYNSTLDICQGESIIIHGVSQNTSGVYVQTFPLPTGCDSTANVTLVVHALPVIDAGVDQAECEGTDISLFATGAANIVWDVAGVLNGPSFSQAVGTVTYTATGTDANGCVNTDQVDVTINPMPTATISGTASACVGDPALTITFTGANGTSPYTFSYNINGGATQTVTSVGTIATVTAPTGTAGTYNYNLLSVQDASSTTCSQTQVGLATVIINPLPTATVAGTASACVGAPGLTITFTGANGTAPYTFTYNLNGGANQTITSVGNTAIVTAPTGTAGTFNYNLVSVQDASSTTCSQVQAGLAAITINPLPTATIAGTASACVGDPVLTVTFTGADGTAPYTFTYNINGGANQTVTSVGNTATLTASTATAGTFNYNLVSVEDASSTACSQSQVGSAIITINPLPTATIAGTAAGCVGDPGLIVTFTGVNGTAPYTFTYNINGGANLTVTSAGNTATVTAPTGTAGTFNYNLVSVQDASSTSCSQAQGGVASITINALPTATIAGTASACLGDPAMDITFTGANGTAPYTFSYTINGGAIQTVTSIGNTATVSASTGTAGTFIYNLVSVQDASSTNCSQAQVGTATITVNPAPTVDPIADDILCTNDGTAAVNFTSPNAGATFAWTNSNVSIGLGASGNADIASFTGVNAGTTPSIATITVTPTLSGCVGATESFTITVNPLPTIDAGSDFVVCEGTQAILTASGGVSYVWDNNVTNGVAFNPTTSGTYEVIGTDANGCVNTDQVDITVEPIPIVTFTADVTSGCAPLTVTFTNTTAGALDNCVWTFSNGTSITGCGSVTTIFENGGLYDVTLTVYTANGCSSSDTYFDYIYVEDAPLASFSASSSEVSILNTQVYFNNTSVGAETYAWDFGDESAGTNEVNPIHIFPSDEAGNYIVQLIAYSSLGCPDTATQVIVVNEELIFYVPNTFTPDDDDYNEYFKAVFTSGYDPYDFHLLIFNRWGEIIWESFDASIGWDGTYGGKQVQDGTYTWRIDFKTSKNDERKLVTGHVNVLR